jgi:branched-chain amino acid transport system permease protein
MLSDVKRNYIRYAAVAAFVIAVAIMPVFGGHYYLTIGNFIGVYGIAALGLALLIGYAGQVSLAHAAFVGIGAFSSAILTTRFYMNPWLAMAIGVVLAMLIAAVIGIPLLKLEGHVLAVATLALSIVIYTLFIEMRPLTGGYDGISSIPHVSVGGFVFQSDRSNYYLIWTFVLFGFLFASNVANSRVGRALRSIHTSFGGSETAAQSLGISPAKYKIKVFALSAAYASLAGSLYAHWITFVNPEPFNIFISLLMLIMVTIGGMGSLWGALVGSCVIVISGEVFRELLTKLVPGAAGEMEMVAYGLLLILILLFMPRGLVFAPNIIANLLSKRRNRAPIAQNDLSGR